MPLLHEYFRVLKIFYFHLLNLIKFGWTYLWMIATSAASQNWKENTPCDNYQILVMTITLELVLGGTTIGFHIISSYQLNSSLEFLWMEWKGVFPIYVFLKPIILYINLHPIFLPYNMNLVKLKFNSIEYDPIYDEFEFYSIYLNSINFFEFGSIEYELNWIWIELNLNSIQVVCNVIQFFHSNGIFFPSFNHH